MTPKQRVVAATGLVVFVIIVIYGYFLHTQISQLTADLASTTARVVVLEDKANGLSTILTTTEQDLALTKKSVAGVQTQVGGFEQTVGKISTTVGTLEKLSKTDPELLKKYSKIFFLNEHYAPADLTQIPQDYTYSDTRIEKIATPVWPYMKSLLEDAKGNGITIYIKSAYRSFEEQKSVKSAFTVVYGAGSASQFSADQGYSEHQLGTTADFITTGLGGVLDGFDKTKAYDWMVANAYKYGFTLSYPPKNNYYIFEPWHWRFVGVKLATYLHDQGKYFYDLDQRDIDTYLVDLFN